MGTRLVPVENVEQILAFWREGMLLWCMGAPEDVDDPEQYYPVSSDWSEQDLVYEYTSEDTWAANEWRIRLED